MEQFVEVMKQARRLCAAHGSICTDSNCPLDNGEACRLNIDLDGEDYNDLERIIMDWSAEHPEPVYPSWYEYQQQTFPGLKSCWICPLAVGAPCQCKSVTNAQACKKCRNSPIPAEIAEKLGIRPKDIDAEALKAGTPPRGTKGEDA